MKKFLLATTAAAIAYGFSGLSMAALNLDTGMGTGGSYASEITFPTPTVSLEDGVGADQTANAAFGATLATDFVAYVRFDLPAGKTFTAAPTFAVNDSGGTTAIVNVAQGGVGQGFVIFAVAPSAVGNNLVNANIFAFTGNGVTVGDKNAVTLQYRLFETLTNAANQTLSLKTASGNFLEFANAIAITPGATLTQTADVGTPPAAPYVTFVGNVLEVPVASFTVSHTARALLNGLASTAGDILAATNSVAVNGDFTFVSQLPVGGPFPSVNLSGVANCAGAGVDASTLTNTAATFTGLAAAAITANQWYVCVTATGSTAIPIASYSGAIDLVPNTGYSVADGATGTGNIVRNGTVLKAAFTEAATAGTGYSSAVHLTNTRSVAAPYTVACMLNSGTVAGTPGSVPANTAVRNSVTGGLGCPADGTLRGIQLTFESPVGGVIGSVVRQSVTTGQASFDGMIGNQ